LDIPTSRLLDGHFTICYYQYEFGCGSGRGVYIAAEGSIISEKTAIVSWDGRWYDKLVRLRQYWTNVSRRSRMILRYERPNVDVYFNLSGSHMVRNQSENPASDEYECARGV
jgi:hypothetical protein